MFNSEEGIVNEIVLSPFVQFFSPIGLFPPPPKKKDNSFVLHQDHSLKKESKQRSGSATLYIYYMVNSDIGAHVRSNLCYLYKAFD